MRTKEYWRNYYANHKDICKERMKVYAENNKEKISERHKAYYLTNKEKIETYRKKWRLEKRIEKLKSDIEELKEYKTAVEDEIAFLMTALIEKQGNSDELMLHKNDLNKQLSSFSIKLTHKKEKLQRLKGELLFLENPEDDEGDNL